jgi:beta-glucosidase
MQPKAACACHVWLHRRFGRFYESFAEDPHLVSVFGMFMTLGIQGTPSSPHDYLAANTAACEAKHMAAYGAAGKDGAASEVSEATFFNKYWPPWILYAHAGGRGVMPSHQLTTAFMLPSHANKFMITGLWRGVLGMNESFVSSDCGDIGQILSAFRLAKDGASAAAAALNAGVDQDLCVSTYETGLPAALKQGLVSQKRLDVAVSNILRQKFAARLFDGAWRVDPQTVTDKLDTYRPLALAAAHQGITLLTNVNGTLPMSFRHKNILVVGSLANDESSHTGGYTNGGAHVVTTWEAVQSVCNATEGCSAELAQGASPDSFDTSGIAPAVDGVQKADFVIAVVGDSENTAGENRDVDDLDLNGAQLPLLWAVCKAARSRAVPVVAAWCMV